MSTVVNLFTDNILSSIQKNVAIAMQLYDDEDINEYQQEESKSSSITFGWHSLNNSGDPNMSRTWSTHWLEDVLFGNHQHIGTLSVYNTIQSNMCWKAISMLQVGYE
jgi:hypothetical protein